MPAGLERRRPHRQGSAPEPGWVDGHASNFIYLVDVIALLLDHEIAEGDDDAIDPRYVARLACEDWGLCRTVELNISKLLTTLDELDVDRDLVRSRAAKLWAAVDGAPKPLRWRLRAQVGDRLQWYELPEETRSPYQPE